MNFENAGISTGTAVLADDAVASARLEIETNVLGPLVVSRSFAPVPAANEGGAIVNVLSVLSWLAMPVLADDKSRFVKAQLSGDLADLYPSLARS